MVDLATATDKEIADDAKAASSNANLSTCFQKGLDGIATADEMASLSAKVASMVAAPDPE